jgi:hypothetical protein
VSSRAAFAAAAAATLTLALVPWDGSPLQRLAGGAGDGPAPRFDVPLDPAELESAATSLPVGTLYATIAPNESPLVQGNLKAAGQLYLWRHLPVQDASGAAAIVFTYRNGVVVPR